MSRGVFKNYQFVYSTTVSWENEVRKCRRDTDNSKYVSGLKNSKRRKSDRDRETLREAETGTDWKVYKVSLVVRKCGNCHNLPDVLNGGLKHTVYLLKNVTRLLINFYDSSKI